jgi:hypothetical protein
MNGEALQNPILAIVMLTISKKETFFLMSIDIPTDSDKIVKDFSKEGCK